MNKSFLLLVGLMGGFLEAGERGAEAARAAQEAADALVAQAARDQAAREAQEAQAARDAAARKPKRGGWSRRPIKGDPQQQQSGGQGGQQRGGGQPGKGGSVALKGSGGDGDAASALAARARTVTEDPFGNDLDTMSAPTTTRTAPTAPVVTVKDVAKVISGGFEALKSVADNFVVAGSPKEAEMLHQAEELENAVKRFERAGGKEPAALKRVARDASKVVGIVGDRPVDEIAVSQGLGGLRISAGGKSATVREITMSFVPKGIFGKIMFCWRRYKMRRIVSSTTQYRKLNDFANQIASRLDIPYKNKNADITKARDFIEQHENAGVSLDWEDFLGKK